MADPTVTHTVAPPTAKRTPAPALVGPGSLLGRYEIVAPIGSGGMADVWLGRATGHGGFARLLAIKTARVSVASDPRLHAMFLKEGEIAAGIRHANVVDVLDVGESDGVLYQVMTLVEGDSLAGLLEKTQGAPLALGVTLSIVIDALRGLHASHECTDARGAPRHLVHRDVSPQNILVGLDGLARVSDFGIASVLSDDDETTGTLRGKYAYFAPEQARRESLDRRTDVFAMGVVLWEALAGVRLFKGRDAVETLEFVRSASVADPRAHVKELPSAIVEVVMRALERAPDARYPSAAAMADALAQAARSADIVPERSEVARTVDALVGVRVRALVREGNTTTSPRPARAEDAAVGARRTPRLALRLLPLFAMGAVAVVVLLMRGRTAPAANLPPAPSAAASEAPPVVSATPAAPVESATPAATTASALPPPRPRDRHPHGPVEHPTATAPPPPPPSAPTSSSRKPPFEQNPFAAPSAKP